MTRYFGKLGYEFFDWFESKTAAAQCATRHRDAGFFARVVPGDGGWEVWIR